ncbi:MAG: diacylglycerol/lipid kinase family protein [Myxococcota bacterium]
MGDRAFRDLAVVVNAHAGRVRRAPGLHERLTRLVGASRLAWTTTAEEAAAALPELREAGVDALAIVGGDGTVTGTLTPLLRAWNDESKDLPAIALLAGGTINTIARGLGASGPPDRALERLIAEGPSRVRPLECLAVRSAADGAASGCEPPPRYGMIFGLGVVARWLERYYASAARGPGAAAAVVARSVGSILIRGALARDLFAPFEAKLETDQVAIDTMQISGLAAGALPEIGLGFRPFFTAGKADGRFHWIWTDTPGPALLLEMPAARLGRALPGGALRHGSTSRLSIRLSRPESFTVDGDLFGPSDALDLTVGPELRLLVA